MAALATTLVDFQVNGTNRTYLLPNHTVAEPHLLVQRRKVATTPTGVAEDSIRVLSGTTDSAGAVLPARTSIEIIVRRPVNGDAADVTAVLGWARDVVQSDNFGAVVTGQAWLKA
jgi:hypothetical protein